MLRPEAAANRLLETVYHTQGIDAATRNGIIQDTCDQFSDSQLIRLSPGKAAGLLKCLSALACEPSLRVVSKGDRHDRTVAEEVLVNLGIVANLVLDTPELDLDNKFLAGVLGETAVMGILWAGLSSDAKQPGHARFATFGEDATTASASALSNGFDIHYTVPSITMRKPDRNKLQVKSSRPGYHQNSSGTAMRIKRYEDDIVVVPVDELAPVNELLAEMAALNVDTLTFQAQKIDTMIRMQNALRLAEISARKATRLAARKAALELVHTYRSQIDSVA